MLHQLGDHIKVKDQQKLCFRQFSIFKLTKQTYLNAKRFYIIFHTLISKYSDVQIFYPKLVETSLAATQLWYGNNSCDLLIILVAFYDTRLSPCPVAYHDKYDKQELQQFFSSSRKSQRDSAR